MPNFRKLIETLSVQDKDSATLRRLDLSDDFSWAQRGLVREVQRQWDQNIPIRIIVLKARQLGLSTISEGIMFLWAFLRQGTTGLVIAHENDASMRLFQMSRLFWETWPFKDLYTAKSTTQRTMTWKETRSALRIATAKNLGAGRSFTLHAVHASEAAFYLNPGPLMLGLNQTIPSRAGTIQIIETTANGIGNWFHEQWITAENGESDFVPLFFPFYKSPEYKIQTTLSTALELDADERQLIRIGADYEAVAWRRWAIRNLCENDEQFFMQEYPATPTEAFISTGTNVFPLQHLDECYVPKKAYRGLLIGNEDGMAPRFFSEPTGPLYVYKAPTKKDQRSDRYFIAGDPCMTLRGDPACIQVINRETMEQVAVWHGHLDPINFAREMMLLGRWYHDAELCPEVEGGGQATVATLINANYPNIWQHHWADKAPGKVALTYGWATNYQRKNWAIGKLRFLIGDCAIVIHDKRTYDQLRNYITHPNGEMGNADPMIHDDAVMALSIGVTASDSEGPFQINDTPPNVFDLYGEG